MNDKNCVQSDQYKRIQGGILKIQNKNVCVYKGVNTLGRNKTAIINLKNLNVSQNHAIILIVDDTQHFISDLNSSNGTYLVGTKLSPYKLYELVNDVEIKFGDVLAYYFKVSNADTTLHLENEHSDMTQNMTQSFYGASTQLIINESLLNHTRKNSVTSKLNVDLNDIHEAATQVVVYPPRITKFKESSDSEHSNSTSELYDKNIHEAPTQVIDYQQATTSKTGLDTSDTKTESDSQLNGELKETPVGDIHDIETQVVVRPKEIVENNSIEQHDSSVQICEDVPKMEGSSQLKVKSVVSTAGTSFVEETVIEETVIEENWIQNDDSNDSIDFLAGHKPLENENTHSKEEELKTDTDSFLETQEVGASKKKPVRKLSSSEDFTQPDSDKKTRDSDSETDFESEIIKSKKSKQGDNSGSDTEIEDDLPERFKTDKKMLNSDSETDIEDHKDSADRLVESQGVIKPKILTKKRVFDSDSDTDAEDKEPTGNKSGNASELLNDTDFIPATQDAFAEAFMYKNSKMSSGNTQNLSSEESFKLGLTELMVESVENKTEQKQNVVNEENTTDKMKVSDNSDQYSLINENQKDIIEEKVVEDLYMMPTQKISAQVEITRKSDLNQDNVSSIPASVTTVEAEVVPTQEPNKKDTENEHVSTPSTSKANIIEKQADEDFYMMATQKFNEKNTENENVSTPSTSKSSVVEKEADEDFYMMATQKFNEKNTGNENVSTPSTSKSSAVEKQADEDFYMMPTQKFNEKNTENENVSTPSTSKSSVVEKEADEDLYMMATQKLNEDNSESQFKTPRKQFNFRRKKVVLDASLSTIFGKNQSDTQPKQENEDIYLQATQKLKEDTQNDLYSRQTQDLNLKPNTSEVSREEEEFYMAPTQKINIEENEEKSEGVLKQKDENKNAATATEKIEDLYMMATQQVNTDPPPISDLYLQETQKISVDQKLVVTKTGEDSELSSAKTIDGNNAAALKILEEKDEDAYMAPTQQICTDLATKEVAPTKCLADLYLQETQDIKHLQPNTSVKDEAVFKSPIQEINQGLNPQIKNNSRVSSGEKRKVEFDSNTSKVKRVKKTTGDEAETLSQIDAFVKQSFGVKKETPKVNLISKAKPVDQSETLSQIQRFVEAPFVSDTKTKIKTVPKKRGGISSGTNKEMSATAQNETVVKKPSNNSNELGKEKNLDEIKEVSDKSESVSGETSKSESDTTKHDIEKSFALLEAKSTKTRKSKRLTDSTDVKIALCNNRRSMAVVPEPSIALESRPSTRKSNKKTTNLNNNNLPTIPDSSELKITGRSKRKLESTKKEPDPESCESDKPNKISRTTRAKKGKQKDEIDTLPSTSKLIDNSKATTSKKDSDSNSSTSIEITLSTPKRGRRTTVLSTSDVATPEKSKRKTKPKVVFTMLDSPLLESLIKQLGGSVVDSVDSSTVLVTEHVKRSQKLLAAIGQGKPICSPEWIRASKKANEFLDPWDFILLDKEAESKWNFSLNESLTRASKEKLLGNYTFQLIVSNAADVLKGAIEACGGKCVPRHPAKSTDGFFVVVSSPENRSKYLKIKKQRPQVTVVEPEAVFDGVLRQDLRLGRHLLT